MGQPVPEPDDSVTWAGGSPTGWVSRRNLHRPDILNHIFTLRNKDVKFSLRQVKLTFIRIATKLAPCREFPGPWLPQLTQLCRRVIRCTPQKHAAAGTRRHGPWCGAKWSLAATCRHRPPMPWRPCSGYTWHWLPVSPVPSPRPGFRRNCAARSWTTRRAFSAPVKALAILAPCNPGGWQHARFDPHPDHGVGRML